MLRNTGRQSRSQTLPCRHDPHITNQVQPTIQLLENMDELHPDVLLQHAIQPNEYKGSLLFRSAVESIRGRFIASSASGREAFVGKVLEGLKEQERIADYYEADPGTRYDWTVQLQQNPDVFAAIEVKGGEGNSLSISDRPRWVREFALWCHLDGAIVNQPAHGASAIVSRVVNELVWHQKRVDAVFFKDILCGTHTRPCPKYGRQGDCMGLRTAPDVFLFPQHIPQVRDPEPPVHTLETLRLPGLVLDLFGVPKHSRWKHVWTVHVRVDRLEGNRLRHRLEVRHRGQVVSSSTARARSREQ